MRVATLPERHVSASERRLEELVLRLSNLDAEYDALAAAVSDFEDQSAERLGPALEELSRAQRVIRRLEQVQAELDADLERSRELARSRTRKAPRHTAPQARPPRVRDARGDVDVVVPDVNAPLPRDLKELYRQLARRMHPDLATSEADRARRSHVLARLNAAFAEEDRVRLELLAAEIESGVGIESTEDMRETYAERRIASLALSVEQLEGELRGLRESSAFRRTEERRLREERGEDHFAAEIRSMKDRASTIRSSFRVAASRVDSSLLTLNTALLEKTGVSPPRVSFRPTVVETGHPTAEGRRFAEKLGETARLTPWKAAWIVAAFFGEMADRPPTGLRSLEAWRERWECLRPVVRSAPPFDMALTQLPTELELGCRLGASGVRFGVQLRDPLHVAGVAAALELPSVRTVAVDVLSAIGRQVTCGKCRAAVHAVHLHRVGDLDPLHALVCPRCGSFLESYRAYGRPEGEEALSPFALALGVVEEQSVSFGGVLVRLEMLPTERRRLTARRLTERFASALLEGLSLELGERPLTVRARGAILAPSAAVPRGAPVTLSFAVGGGAPSAKRVVALLRARRGRRFRRA